MPVRVTEAKSECRAEHENPEVLLAQILVEKTPAKQSIPAGTMAEFTIKVTNTGKFTLEKVEVKDLATAECEKNVAQFEALEVKEGLTKGKLKAGESVTYSCKTTPDPAEASGTEPTLLDPSALRQEQALLGVEYDAGQGVQSACLLLPQPES